MCGRFTLNVDPVELANMIPHLRVDETPPAWYNIAPSQPVAAVLNEEEPRLTYLHWGLIPFWAKDKSIGNKLFNARGETVHEKPAFRAAFKSRRCLILADGFYEWQQLPDKRKQPIYFRMKTGELFAFAGLWERWNDPDGQELRSGTIITTTPNPLIKQYHHRMPVILPRDAYQTWLTPGEMAAGELRGFIQSYPSEAMEAYPVDSAVNKAGHNIPPRELNLNQ